MGGGAVALVISSSAAVRRAGSRRDGLVGRRILDQLLANVRGPIREGNAPPPRLPRGHLGEEAHSLPDHECRFVMGLAN